MEVTSPLTFEISGEPFLLEKRIRLLHAINEHGSISKAAKAVPMSYKSAWEAVDAMNALSPEPIVFRETGGKDGGGTTITAYGMQLLENYALLKEEHNRFLERLSKLTDIQSGAFKTIGRLGLQISARNQIQAVVTAVEPGEVNAKVHLKLKSGQELVSVITEEAVEDLDIKEGQVVTAICKSSNVYLLAENENKNEMENHLEGRVVQMEKDRKNAKITVDIGEHDTIVSVMSLANFEKWAIAESSSVIVVIEAKNLMLGR
ncbi:TOBE domain-containing protein [Sulfurovum sp. NBC37-1]|uniref:TOBE domain-containing protein n=1 Tax=Sulfurovum sp. (strain NBC37-1) TaxID=387093 RepID=UPI0001587B3C|nr:TOBE domain-containing protein [Sulfurovum sp. NBC37-1]BAF73047.1 molybdenum transport regulatory protein [Sulfurovum sp. NBC37-1]